MTATITRQRVMERSAKAAANDIQPPPDERQKNRLIQAMGAAMPWIFGLVVAASLFAGYRLRHLELTTAEHGAGYMLGIVGASMMLLLLLYPLRKRVRGLAFMGGNRFWFRLHMIFGVAGPVLILYHANFTLGSTNSNVALISMLVVAGSGLIGRYIYAKIHHGLYGRKASLAELRGTLDDARSDIAALFAVSSRLRNELFAFSERVLQEPSGVLHGLGRMVVTRIDAARTRRRVHRLARRDIVARSQEAGWSRTEARRLLRHVDIKSRAFVREARAVSEFALYERLFSLWHVLHLPLFFMLVIAAIVHVIAVHFY